MKPKRKRIAKVVFGILAVLFGLLCWGTWVENNMYVTHNPTVAIGQYIDKTGRWPTSWNEFEDAGIHLPSTVRHVEVAWQILPYELLAAGKIMGESPLSEGYCSVVFRPHDKPDVSKIDWHLHPILAEALRSAKSPIAESSEGLE